MHQSYLFPLSPSPLPGTSMVSLAAQPAGHRRRLSRQEHQVVERLQWKVGEHDQHWITGEKIRAIYWEMVYLSYYSLRDSTVALLASTLGVNNYRGYIEKIESDENISLKSFPYRSVVFCGPHTIVSSSPPTATHTTTFPSGDPTPPMVPALLPSLESLIFLAMTRESSTYL